MTSVPPSIFRLDYKVQSYDWGKLGSSSKAAKFASSSPGFVVDENRPYAELWMGTHINGPSTLYESDTTLESVLKTNPQLLTPYLFERYHGHLPFLFKVLSINKALSIQAHPDRKLAEKLFQERPNTYKDDNHKPEMAIALTEFEALCGFRPLQEISTALDTWKELRDLVGEDSVTEFRRDSDGHRALKTLYGAVMTAEATQVKHQLDLLIARLNAQGTVYAPQSIEELVLRIHSQFPGDVGVFSLFFLNYIVLQPGQAIFLAANEPHAYLSGECMAASDNVVRAGLTPKFKDVQVLMEMLTYQSKSGSEQLLTPTPYAPHSLLYDPPIDEFSVILTALENAQEKESLPGIQGPSIVIVTGGKGVIKSEGVEEITAEIGNVFFVGANVPFSIETSSEQGVTIYTAFSVKPEN
ncbi:Mannose-6-phosphate isomerase [Mortierella sp. GBA43]|nr:Mannose-6-phosphate isomerase [Mortierella sp. GBA43]